jgi:hypothetical protein
VWDPSLACEDGEVNDEPAQPQLPAVPTLVPPTWGWPSWAQRQRDPQSPSFVPGGGGTPPVNVTRRDWVVLGTLAHPQRAVVDASGLVTPWEGAWSLDWWVAAEDRWYLPARETAVRQRLVDGSPVVETSMRVHGGDVVHRVWAITGDDGDPWLIVEVENRTAAAVAVAVAIRPWGPTGPARVASVGLDERWLTVDDQPVVALPRAPWRAYGSTAGDIPLVAEVLAGGDSSLESSHVCSAGAAEAAAVVPLPHTLAVRFFVPMTVPSAPGPTGRRRRVPPPEVPTGAPAAEQVAAGWAVQAGRGPSVSLPDPVFDPVVAAARRHLLLVPAGEDVLSWPTTEVDYPAMASVLAALDAWGYADEAGDVLSSWEERQALDGRFLGDDRRRDAAGAALVALGTHWRLTGDTRLPEALLGPVAKAAHWIDRRAQSRRHRRDPATVGLLPDGDQPRWVGPVGVSYHDAWWSLAGLREASAMLAAVDQPDASAEVLGQLDRLGAALRASLATDATRLGVAVVPAGPGRAPDGGAVAILDAVLLGVLEPDDPAVTATLDWLRHTCVVDGLVHESVPATGVSAVLTARLARVELARGEASGVERIRALLGAATPVVTWPEVQHPRSGGGILGQGQHAAATAEVLLALRDLVVRWSASPRAAGDDGEVVLELAPVVPEAWWGRTWEIHDLPTPAGRLGYAVRWHGERPAVLWQLEPFDGAPVPARLRMPGLDPAWETQTPVGEALLAAPLGAAPVHAAPSSAPDPAEPVDEGGFS